MGKPGPKTEAGLQAVRENAKHLDHSAWTKNPKAVEAITVARRMRKTTHGLYASVPIICKGHLCPYAQTCPLLEQGLAPEMEKCPLEIAAIEDLFQRYCEALQIDTEDPQSTIDLVMVKDLVDADIALMRCDNKMAIDADYIIENVVSITENGEVITNQALHPLTEYKEKLINRKNKTLQLLNSTRKDRQAGQSNVINDPSERAAQMMSVLNEMRKHFEAEEKKKEQYLGNYNEQEETIIDVEPIDFEEDDDEMEGV